MKKILLLSIIILNIFAFQSCSGDDNDIKGADSSTQSYLSKGINVNSAGGTIDLCVNHPVGLLDAVCQASWVDIETEQVQESFVNTLLHLRVDSNGDMLPRSTILRLSVGSVSKEIKIEQAAEGRIECAEEVCYADSDGGELQVTVRTNLSQLNPKITYASDDEWLTFVDVVKDRLKPEQTLIFKLRANDGLGRLCSVSLSADARFCIVQQPRQFSESETIEIENEGTLDVLMGSDIDNIRHVRHLKLVGTMNSIDWSALRKMFVKGYAADPNPASIPVELDLSEIVSVRGDRSYFKKFGYEAEEPEFYCVNNNEIPKNMFSRAQNLYGVILPRTTHTICQNAFEDTRISSVDIPDAVETIEYGAFQLCADLTEVNIGNASRLTRLERYAFASSGPIKYMNLPATLIDIEAGYLNFAVVELKVHWIVPPQLRVPPATGEESILFVPEGTADAYRASFGWNRFPLIVEFEDIRTER